MSTDRHTTTPEEIMRFAGRGEVLEHLQRALPADGNEIANTEPSPVSTSLAVAKRDEASEGPERDGHKPLMRNRTATDATPTGVTASDTFQNERTEPEPGIKGVLDYFNRRFGINE